ncbi:MAG TPA: DUF5060 domain-containing protein [Terriglobia bacterium]|nr:DUF5060 domain-containing protein [Terriglobia bacterium]
MRAWVCQVSCFCVLLGGCRAPTPLRVTFVQSANTIEPYDFVEVGANVSWPRVQNPFTGATLSGWFESADGSRKWRVDGFCDSEDGSVFRIRFMPPTPGDYRYSVEYREGSRSSKSAGKFHATRGQRRGPIRVDPQNRWHFLWEGTGEHYFFNGTTAYWLMGWADDKVIESSIERLHRLKVNRVRVTIAGRTSLYYGEPVMAGRNWTPFITPWPAGRGVRVLHLVGRLGQRFGMGLGLDLFDYLADMGRAEDIYHPGFDYTRFQVSYWQKFDRALRFARDRDMIFSLVLDMNDSRVHPAPGSADEYRFIRYAIARFGAFSNITWDLGDDLDQYRDDAWTRATGTLIKEWDPYRHLATSHPVDNAHQDRTSEWFDFTSFQEWSRKQHTFMLAQRKRQQELGRIIPQTNEEYGYEDHYPLWANGPDSDSADSLRRSAWEIVMAGGYQTTGETARRGTNIWPDTGGGWMNGRGDATMTMLEGYKHMVDYFTSFDWWKTEPHDELVNNGNYCLAKPGELYSVYLPNGGQATLKLQGGPYHIIRFDPSTGKRTSLPAAKGPVWTSPSAPGRVDWALLLHKN